MRSFTIRGRTITDTSPSYVIAECSHNHQGDFAIAQQMFRVAKECGADAVKLQKRSPSFYVALREKGLDDYATLRESRELSKADYRNLSMIASHYGLAFIVTAFDVDSLDFLIKVGVDAIKLASGAIHNVTLLEQAQATDFSVIVSTGCATIHDVSNAVWCERKNTCLLQCTSSYPCASSDMHLRTITEYRALYPATIIGLSSHHPSNFLEPVSYALGARIFEKHFTLSRDLGPGDHPNSIDPAGLRELVANLRAVEAAMGDGVKRFLPCEEEGRKRLDVTYNPAANVAQAMAV
jgi:sialic acid synthase